MFMQGDKDDVPGGGIAHVTAGVTSIKLERLEGVPQLLTAFLGADVGKPGRKAEAVQSALDFFNEVGFNHSGRMSCNCQLLKINNGVSKIQTREPDVFSFLFSCVLTTQTFYFHSQTPHL